MFDEDSNELSSYNIGHDSNECKLSQTLALLKKTEQILKVSIRFLFAMSKWLDILHVITFDNVDFKAIYQHHIYRTV